MANSSENIVYKITVDAELGVATVRNLKGQIVATKVPVQELRKEFGNFAKTVDSTKFNTFKKGLDSVVKSNQNLRTASGGATSSVMELGRVISDAPYGIRGMANNITQLVSQMGFAVKTSGSLTLALKDMWKALMGPLGIVLAITTAVSALDFFAGGQKKSEKATSDFRQEVEELARVLGNDLNVNIKDYIKLLKDKKILDEELLKNADKINDYERELNTLNERRLSLEKRRISAFRKRKMLESIQKREIELQSKILKIYETSADAVNDYKESKDDATKADADSLKGLKNELSILKKRREVLSKTPEDYKRLSVEIDALQDKIDEIEEKNKRKKAFALITPDSIKKQVKFGEKLIKAVAEAMNIELGKKPIDINKALDFKLSDETIEAIKKYNEEVAGQMALEDKLSETQEGIEKSKKILGTMTDFMNAQFDREMTIEANKTNALNAELNNRLLNENLSKEERAKIQNQIAINDEKLRKKQEKIAKKQFNMNKAANIATALMDTSAAAIGVMKDAKGGFFARLAQALPTIAFGLAQVATISRQKFQTSAAKTPIRTSTGGIDGGASGGRTAPAFNVVGMSNGNQLVETIQTQFSKPLKAYVVSRDVTTQQQLDGMIVGQAGT
jgi:chromosome segregation ATPase